jgi:hypothetical protein
MANLYSIPGITDVEVENLKVAGYARTEALWSKLAEDKKDTLKDLAIAAGLSAARLATLLAADVARNAPSVDGSIVRRHWIDLSIAVAAVLLLWALLIWRPVLPGKTALTLFRVSLKQTPADAARKTPYSAILVASPHAAAEPVLEEVTVVEVHQGLAPTATLALKEEQVRHIGRLLGSADLYLLQRVE